MYKIRSEAEERVYECDLQFAVYDDSKYGGYIYETKLVAASFTGRPTPAQAISAGMIMDIGRYFTILTPEFNTTCKPISMNVFTDRVEDVVHVVAVPKDNSNIIIALDGDIDKALTAWVCSRYAVPRELDYTKIFNLIELTVETNPLASQWKDMRACIVDSVIYRADSQINEAIVLEAIERGLKEKRLLIPPSPVEGVFNPDMSLQEYLKANAGVFAERLNHVKPLHSLEKKKNSLHPAIVMKRIPFPVQAHTIQGLVKALDHQNSTILCGDMGTGKSIIALGVSNVLYEKRNKKPTHVLLSAPGITIPKWSEKEIKETLPEANVNIINSTDDAARYLHQARNNKLPSGLNFVLVGTDRAKLGPIPWCAALWKRIREVEDGKAVLGEYAWHCPDCGKWIPDPLLKKEEKEKMELPAGWTLFAAEPRKKGMFNRNGVAQQKICWRLPAKLKKCPRCGASLWRPALKSRGETRNRPRWYVADILKRLGKHFHLYIADEVHQTKAQDSGRGFAFAQMVKASKKTLALTGTLLNGMSTSIKEILWRTDPASLLKQGFDHTTGMVEWASRYGVLERVIRVKTEDNGIVTRRKRVAQQPKEKPGIAPDLVATHLLHRAAFIELQDLGLPIVDLKEVPVFVQLDQEHQDEYDTFHTVLYNTCKAAFAKGVQGAFAKFIPATINAVDRADLDNIVDIDGEKIRFNGFSKDYYSAKERKLVEIVKENLAQDRGCIIYTYYTDRYGINERLQKVLQDHDIQAEILKSHVSPDKRFQWLQEAEERGAKVIICNLRLVETGLDLYAWPTLIFYQMSYDINSVRQASRRAWRIGQMRECRTYYMVADGTQQVVQFKSCMSKRAHAMLAEGRLDKSELSYFGRDATSALAADLAACLAGGELETKWSKLAAKDLDIETVSEQDYKNILHKTQKDLVNETFQLCGIDEEIETVSPVPPSNWDNKNNDNIYIVRRNTRRRKKKQIPGQLTLFDLVERGCS